MGKLDLQAALGGSGALAEYLKNEPRAVDHLGFSRCFEISLLDRRDRRVNDDELGLSRRRRLPNRLNLARSEQGRGFGRANAEGQLLLDLDPDRLGQTRRLIETRFRASAGVAAQFGKRDDRLRASCNLIALVALKPAQLSDSSSSDSTKLTGRSGCTVEIACL
jgi:hypothetical protein